MTRRADPALSYPLTVYYDASCGLCAREIATLAARDAEDLLRFVDCSSGALTETDVTREAMMARIHARDAAERWLRGLDVFAAIYRAAGLFVLAKVYASPPLRPLLDRLYAWVADHRRLLSRLGFARLFRLVPVARPRCDACAVPPPR